MPPKGHKRKASDSASSPSKKAAVQNGSAPHAEQAGVIQREFYPPELSNERCAKYSNGEITRPIEILEAAVKDYASQRNEIKAGNAVVHWFKRDLRLQDNRSLYLASEKAKKEKIPLVCVYLVSPQDYQAHVTSAVRVDYELRTLEVMKADLAELDIPLHVETVQERNKVPERLMELCKEWGANHLFCNIEYEVDELRREASLIKRSLKDGISFTTVHDDVVVAPGELATGQGKQYSVYTPWYRAWVAHIHSNLDLIDLFHMPSKNPQSARKKFSGIFGEQIPAAPTNKTLSEKEKERFRSLWPAGEHEAHQRLDKFLAERVGQYKETRNLPAANSTSMLSVHLSTGTVSARSAVRKARDANSGKKTAKLDGGSAGVVTWISEIAWRDFYKHVMCHWPYVCMNKPWKYSMSNIKWEYNDEHFEKWCKGMTGFPLIDAAMRQLNHMGYMHNRCRMAVASFLAKDLLLDWRMGEKYFMEKLIDGDFASNNGGWGFSASTGVDPQPYFRIFNPLLQSEKFDAEGEYIRKWVEELRDVQGKAIHDPYNRGAAKQAEQSGYPRPIVDHKTCRERALQRYREAS